ncbi:MAG: caspase family protein, partial [Nitratireductor sp.]
MRRVSFACAVLAWFTLLAVADVPLACAAGKRALVIGVNDYVNLPNSLSLQKAVADADTIAEVLAKLSYSVTKVHGPGHAEFLSELDSFANTIETGDTVVFFFAGHGISLKGSNLLVPGDIPEIALANETLIRGLTVAEADIINLFQRRDAGLIVMVLDACRDNPIEEAARVRAEQEGRPFRDLGRGKTGGISPRPVSGVFSIYSAGLGQRALDRLGPEDRSPNSVFTRVFASRLGDADTHLAELMEEVRAEVAEVAAHYIDPETGRPFRQYPAYYNETQGGRFYLGSAPRSSPATGVFKSYASVKGGTVFDGGNLDHSPYMTALTETILRGENTLRDGAAELRGKVIDLTDGLQVPETIDSSVGSFRFSGGTDGDSRKRLALLVGGSAYQYLPELPKVASDLDHLFGILKDELGFEVF